MISVLFLYQPACWLIFTAYSTTTADQDYVSYLHKAAFSLLSLKLIIFDSETFL